MSEPSLKPPTRVPLSWVSSRVGVVATPRSSNVTVWTATRASVPTSCAECPSWAGSCPACVHTVLASASTRVRVTDSVRTGLGSPGSPIDSTKMPPDGETHTWLGASTLPVLGGCASPVLRLTIVNSSVEDRHTSDSTRSKPHAARPGRTFCQAVPPFWVPSARTYVLVLLAATATTSSLRSASNSAGWTHARASVPSGWTSA